MRVFQELETPQLVELDSEMSFIIATEIDLSDMKNGLIFMKGKSYNYEDGELRKRPVKQVQYSVTEDVYYDVDESGKEID